MTISKRDKRTIIFILILIIFGIVTLNFISNLDKDEINVVEGIDDTENSELYIIRKYEDNKYDRNNVIYGFMDKNGQTVIEPKYKAVTPFYEGIACVKDINDYEYLIDKNDNKICDIDGFYTGTYDGLWHIQKENKNGCIDKNGEWIIEPKFNNRLDFSEELAAAELNNKWGYIDRFGEWVIEPKFDSGFEFAENLSAVEIKGKWGYIDKNRDWAIEPKFDKAFGFSEGIAHVELDGKRGYIDNKGEWVINPQSMPMREFKNGYAQIYENNKVGIINSKGEVIVETKYDDIYISAEDNGWFIFKQNDLYGVFSVTGEEVIKPIYEMCYRMDKTIILKDRDTIYFFDENLNVKNEHKIGIGLIFEYNQDKDVINLITEVKQFYFNSDGQLLREGDIL
ncbi:hypothetical protein SH2C18_14900 [Clostridium sediminicola]|uniref:WG repeat-containing protein n=1 Tax=Clostridium sediminicola TaxID=3114879 RepID=UPI0031F26DE0